MALIWPAKDPDEVLDYSWTIPVDAGDTLATADITKVSGNVVIDSQDTDGNVRTAFLSGGTDGEVCEFRGIATTAGGRTYEETFFLQIAASDAPSPFLGQFVSAFPAFAAVPPASVAFWKAEADRVIAPLSSCLGERADLATMLLTAHYLTLAGAGAGAEAEMAAQGATGFKRIRSGSLELERGDAGNGDAGSFGATSYGARVWPMLRACVSGPMVAGTGRIVGGCGFNGFAGPLPPWNC
jgi:hypothetical protein